MPVGEAKTLTCSGRCRGGSRMAWRVRRSLEMVPLLRAETMAAYVWVAVTATPLARSGIGWSWREVDYLQQRTI